MQPTERGFPEWMKILVDRICESQSIIRAELAKRLNVHLNSITIAAYKGEISIQLVEKVAKLAGVTAEELTEIELAWLRLRALRPRDEALRRAFRFIYLLIDEVTAAEDFMSRKGLLEAYLRSRKRTKGRPLDELARDTLEGT